MISLYVLPVRNKVVEQRDQIERARLQAVAEVDRRERQLAYLDELVAALEVRTEPPGEPVSGGGWKGCAHDPRACHPKLPRRAVA
ncbi:MAG: hypothetical protein GEU80_10250 [Dehalococcoidia bacterium]|nr:hypothetical protein [Dehalococcoidia bacterium]